MIPEAVPRTATGTLVPSLVAATEDSPMPAPPTATHTGSAHVLLAAGMSAASQTAMIARPATDQTLRQATAPAPERQVRSRR